MAAPEPRPLPSASSRSGMAMTAGRPRGEVERRRPLPVAGQRGRQPPSVPARAARPGNRRSRPRGRRGGCRGSRAGTRPPTAAARSRSTVATPTASSRVVAPAWSSAAPARPLPAASPNRSGRFIGTIARSSPGSSADHRLAAKPQGRQQVADAIRLVRLPGERHRPVHRGEARRETGKGAGVVVALTEDRMEKNRAPSSRRLAGPRGHPRPVRRRCGGAATSRPAPATAPPASAAPASVSPAGSDAVTIAGFAFAPASLTVKVGSSVTWTNKDSATHTVTWDDGSQGSGSLTAGGAPYTQTFATAGTFAYHCSIHSSMKGTIVVEP